MGLYMYWTNTNFIKTKTANLPTRVEGGEDSAWRADTVCFVRKLEENRISMAFIYWDVFVVGEKKKTSRNDAPTKQLIN